MTSQGILSTPHGSIRATESINNTFPEEFTLNLVADTAKTPVEADFGAMKTSMGNYAIVIDTLKGPAGVQVTMHQTAAEDAITTTELADRFGPIMTKGVSNKQYPISSPFIHVHTDGYLTFIADMDCTIIGRILRISTNA